jgi:hypothetical protein
MTTVEITGIPELKAALERASRSLSDRELSRIMVDSAGGMVGIARDDARKVNSGSTTKLPNGKERKIKPKRVIKGSRSRVKFTLQPGTISRSIKTKVLKGNVPVVIVAPIYTKNPNTDPWFAHFVHEGTADRNYQGKSRGAFGDRTRPVRFMERAGSNAIRSYTAGVIVKKIMQKLATV